MTIILNLRSVSGREAAKRIRQAAQIIKNGGIVVFPTETVYGIGANALDAKACKKIYSIKGRASDNPLIVHVSSLEMASRIGEIPKKYIRILSKVWPAPLTVIVRAKKQLPKVVTGGLNTVA
ncbi:Sua5/YciO/YrdC/YwlC family protein, partial [mine drainage metagenome]